MDPTQPNPVWGVWTADGSRFEIVWPPGFRLQAAPGAVLVDTYGQIVGRHGLLMERAGGSGGDGYPYVICSLGDVVYPLSLPEASAGASVSAVDDVRPADGAWDPAAPEGGDAAGSGNGQWSQAAAVSSSAIGSEASTSPASPSGDSPSAPACAARAFAEVSAS